MPLNENSIINVQAADSVYESPIINAFTGNWAPSIEPTLLSPEGYKTLINFRPTEDGIQGVNGYKKVNIDDLGFNVYNMIQATKQHSDGTLDSKIILKVDKDAFYEVDKYATDTVASSDAIEVATNFQGGHPAEPHEYSGDFSEGTSNDIIYCGAHGSYTYKPFTDTANLVYTSETGDHPSHIDKVIDVTEKAKDTNDNTFTPKVESNQCCIVVLASRPIVGIDVDIETPATGSTHDVYVYDHTTLGWQIEVHEVDNTHGFTQSGTILFEDLYNTKLYPLYISGTSLYAYAIHINPVTDAPHVKSIKYIYGMQSISDVWDGVNRQPTYCAVYKNGSYKDYTLDINSDSLSSATLNIGADISGLRLNEPDEDYIIIGFNEPMSALKFNMIGDKTNTNNNTVLEIKRSTEGGELHNLDCVDSTYGFKSPGVIALTYVYSSQQLPAKLTFNGVSAYFYKIYPKSGSGISSTDVIIDRIYGITEPKKLKQYEFSLPYNNRLLMFGNITDDKLNTIDYSITNSSDIWNGEDTSNNGENPIYVGNVDPIIGAMPLYNRFSSSVLSTLLICKQRETYILLGSTPEDFGILKVSDSLGCVSRKTMSTIEYGVIHGDQRLTNRNYVVWLSENGPVLFDGAIVTPIPGVEKYFDKGFVSIQDKDDITINDNNIAICFEKIDESVGWYDTSKYEYNLIIPWGTKYSTVGDTTVTNISYLWIAYNIKFNKWFRKNPDNGVFPRFGIQIISKSGASFIYSGVGEEVPENLLHNSDFTESRLKQNAGGWYTKYTQWITDPLSRSDSEFILQNGQNEYGTYGIKLVANNATPLDTQVYKLTYESYINTYDTSINYLFLLDYYMTLNDIDRSVLENNFYMKLTINFIDSGQHLISSKEITSTVVPSGNGTSGINRIKLIVDNIPANTQFLRVIIESNLTANNNGGGHIGIFNVAIYPSTLITDLSNSIIQLDSSDNWNNTSIKQIIETGDLITSKTPWVSSLIRSIKFVGKSLPTGTTITAEHFKNTSELPNAVFDTVVSETDSVFYNKTVETNLEGLYHRFKLTIDGKPSKPLLWGYTVRPIREV